MHLYHTYIPLSFTVGVGDSTGVNIDSILGAGVTAMNSDVAKVCIMYVQMITVLFWGAGGGNAPPTPFPYMYMYIRIYQSKRHKPVDEIINVGSTDEAAGKHSCINN